MLRLTLPSCQRACVRSLLTQSFRPSFVIGRFSSNATNAHAGPIQEKKWEFKFVADDHQQHTTDNDPTILITNLFPAVQEPTTEQITIIPPKKNHSEQPNDQTNINNEPKLEDTNNITSSTQVILETTTLETLIMKPQITQEETVQEMLHIQGDTQRPLETQDAQDTRGGSTLQDAQGTTQETQVTRTRKYYTAQMNLALANSINDVFKLCMEMKQNRVQPDTTIINTVINAYARIRCSDQAFIMFDQMLQMRLRPTTYTLESLLTVCDVTAEMYRAQEIVKRMREFDIWPSMVSHSYLISIYIKNRKYELAWAEYEAMKAIYNASVPDVLGNFFRLVLTSSDGTWIYNILLEMYNNQIEYTRYEISRAMDIFLMSKDLRGCLLLYKIEGKDLQEGTLVKILSIAAQLQDKPACELIFGAIKEVTQGKPSRLAFYALLSESIYAHDMEGFLDKVNEMSLMGHKLGGVYATKFALICATTAQIDQARAHLASVQAAGKYVGADALSAVMRACARAGDMDRAVGVFTECLNKYNLIPDIEGFNSIIEASEKAGNMDSAENVITQMTAHGVPPTVASFEALIRTCIAAPDLARATQALTSMAAAGLQPTYQIYAGLAELCARAGEHQQASAIVNAMMAAGMKPAGGPNKRLRRRLGSIFGIRKFREDSFGQSLLVDWKFSEG